MVATIDLKSGPPFKMELNMSFDLGAEADSAMPGVCVRAH
jgi:hypothetical protein